jgi:hypothetical protein
MTSFRQIEANRRNVRKSTGPTTEEGKQRAVRHGLTAETVIGALEDAEDYKAFEAAIIADYDAQSAVERELVLRFGCCGGCVAQRLWKLVCSKFTPTIWVGSTSPARFAQALERLSMPCLDGLTQVVSTRRSSIARQRVRNRRRARLHPEIRQNGRQSHHRARALLFAPPARSFLLLMPWIAANHGIEGAVSASAT